MKPGGSRFGFWIERNWKKFCRNWKFVTAVTDFFYFNLYNNIKSVMITSFKESERNKKRLTGGFWSANHVVTI